MSILALNKVNYSYKNGKKVLNDISMEFEKGKFYAILGHSQVRLRLPATGRKR